VITDLLGKNLSPQKVLFRNGALLELPYEASEFSAIGLVVHGLSFQRNNGLARLRPLFEAAGMEAAFFTRSTSREPLLGEITAVLEEARSLGAGWIAGIGGGSVLDLAKAAAGLFYGSRTPADYQDGAKLEKPGIPFLAVPTTAGTGSEATPNSVIINPDQKTKLSIRAPGFLAKKVILDPELLDGLPSSVVRDSGMDAFVQAYEAFISKNASPETDAFALEALRLIHLHLPQAIAHKRREHLEALLLASYYAGVALSAARLGVIHGIAHPLGVLYGVPHGLICAACLTISVRLNRDAMGGKYAVLGKMLGGDFLEITEGLTSGLAVPSPFKGRPLLEKEKIIRETLSSGSTAANPKTITREDVEWFLRELF
jgi:alcohol dehydrogenase class IV